jgi:formylglycine-generating enzyme required for sulfatase activity
MGGDDPDGIPDDGEGPARRVTLSAFGIDRYATRNERLADFVDATGYRTDAERYGWSLVFKGLLPPGRTSMTAAWRPSHSRCCGARRRRCSHPDATPARLRSPDR